MCVCVCVRLTMINFDRMPKGNRLYAAPINYQHNSHKQLRCAERCKYVQKDSHNVTPTDTSTNTQRERKIINFSLSMFSKVKTSLSYPSAFLIADVFGFFCFALNQAANYSILEFWSCSLHTVIFALKSTYKKILPLGSHLGIFGQLFGKSPWRLYLISPLHYSKNRMRTPFSLI